jgi:tetratricopeptide (TPR) repeat protein
VSFRLAPWCADQPDSSAQALPLFQKAGDRAGEALIRSALGLVEERSGNYRAAIDHYAQALILSRQTGNRDSEANTLNNLGFVEVRCGRYGPDDPAAITRVVAGCAPFLNQT